MPKISALHTIEYLTSGSVLPVVDNGETQKVTLQKVIEFVSASLEPTFATDIELLRSASAITSSLNTFASASVLSVASKLSTASFEAYTASVQSTNTSSLLLSSSFNTFTSSYKIDSGSFDSRVDNLELINVSPFLSASTFNTFSSSFDSRLDIVEGINVTPFLSASTFNTYTSSNNSTNTTQNSRLNSLESNSGSYLLKSETGSFITEAETGSFLTSIPIGIISSSTQITAFGFVSQSTNIADFTFTEQTISNSNIILDATNDITLHTGNGNIILNPDGNSYIGSANAGNGIVTDGYLAGIIGDTNTVNNSTGHTITDNLTNIINSIPTIPVGTISGSTQISELGFISSSQTGSFATSGSNTFNGNQTINGSITINISTGIPTGVTNWVGQGGWNQGFYSNISTIGGTGTGLTVDVAAGGGGYINISAISINNPGSGYTDGDIITIDNENNLPGSFTLQVGANSLEFDASGSLVFPDSTTQTTAFIPTTFVTTSSFDTFTSSYTTDSASFDSRINNVTGSAASGTISSSIQITDLGFATTSSVVNVNTSSLLLTSSFNTFATSSNTFSSSVNSTTASLNSKTGSYATTGSNQFNANQSVSGSITAQYNVVAGGYVQTPLIYNGGAIEIRSFYQPLQINSNGAKTIINDSLQVSSSLSVTGSIIGTIAATNGVISGSSQISGLGYTLTSSLANVTPFLSSSTFNTFATSSNTFTASVNTTTASLNTFSSSINTFTSSTNTALSNVYTATASLNTFTSSYTTTSSSFDSRINAIVNGSGFATTSSFNSLSASFNSYSSSHNTFSASVNTFTSSINVWTSSIATTGSNQFNGNQSITGSLTVNSGTIISSSLTANSSSLYLNSGSNFYLQNNGTAEISGSLKVSGSLVLTGSLTIQSGSIIMPNRPAFRVIGAGGPTYATTIISGSMAVVDYNEGGYYNTSNGTFTAPIAGLYQVNLSIRTYSNTNPTINQAIVYKNNTTSSVMVEFGVNTTMNHAGAGTILKLAIGDTLKAGVAVGTCSFDQNDNFSVAYIG